MMKSRKDLPTLQFASLHDWEAWLEENHNSSEGVWIKLAKKNSGIKSISYAEAVEGALCYGWIDGQAAGLDEMYYLQRFTRRRSKSKWSAINREKATVLATHGRLRPAGLREVESARRDGRWDDAYASPRSMTVPDDLQAKLDEHPQAQAFFDSLDSRNRYAILYRIQDAKRADTRAKRIEKFVSMLRSGEKIH